MTQASNIAVRRAQLPSEVRIAAGQGLAAYLSCNTVKLLLLVASLLLVAMPGAPLVANIVPSSKARSPVRSLLLRRLPALKTQNVPRCPSAA